MSEYRTAWELRTPTGRYRDYPFADDTVESDHDRIRALEAENERLRVEVAEAFNEGFEAGIRQAGGDS